MIAEKSEGKGTLFNAAFLIGLVVAAVIATIPHVAAQTTPSTDLGTYVLFATDELGFKGGNDGAGLTGYVLGGNVGVNNAGASMSVGLNARFVMSSGTQLVGDSIRLGELATVYDVFTNEQLGIGWPPHINPQTSQLVVQGTVSTFTPPIITDPFGPTNLNCYDGQFTASEDENDDRFVVSSSPTSPTEILSGGFLAPGTYRDLRVRDGNTLHLGPGVYTLRRFNTGRNVIIYTVPGTILQVTGDTDPGSTDFNLGVGAYFGSEDPAIESVACICYLGDDVQFGRNGEFWGVIKAPNAQLSLGFGYKHFGRFYAKGINSDFNDNVMAKDCTLVEQTTTVTAEKTATGHA
jgi:hypothetical protein